MCCTLTNIDWKYALEVDVGQLWAQAYYYFKKGEPWHLTIEEAEMAADLNAEYEIENPLRDYILEHFWIDRADQTLFMTTTQILDQLKQKNCVKGSDRAAAMQISEIMRKIGCDQQRRRVRDDRKRGWIGVRARQTHEYV